MARNKGTRRAKKRHEAGAAVAQRTSKKAKFNVAISAGKFERMHNAIMVAMDHEYGDNDQLYIDCTKCLLERLVGRQFDLPEPTTEPTTTTPTRTTDRTVTPTPKPVTKCIAVQADIITAPRIELGDTNVVPFEKAAYEEKFLEDGTTTTRSPVAARKQKSRDVKRLEKVLRKIPCPKQRVQALHSFFRRPLGKPLVKSMMPAVEPLSVKVLENIKVLFDVAKANGTTTNDSRTFRRVLYTAMLSPDM